MGVVKVAATVIEARCVDQSDRMAFVVQTYDIDIFCICRRYVESSQSTIEGQTSNSRDCRVCPIPDVSPVHRAMNVDLPDPVMPITGMMISLALKTVSPNF